MFLHGIGCKFETPLLESCFFFIVHISFSLCRGEMSPWNWLPCFPLQLWAGKQTGLLWNLGCLPHCHTEGHQEILLSGIRSSAHSVSSVQWCFFLCHIKCEKTWKVGRMFGRKMWKCLCRSCWAKCIEWGNYLFHVSKLMHSFFLHLSSNAFPVSSWQRSTTRTPTQMTRRPKRSFPSWPKPMRYKTPNSSFSSYTEIISFKPDLLAQYVTAVLFFVCVGAERRVEEKAVWHIRSRRLWPEPCRGWSAAVLQGRWDHYRSWGALQEDLWRVFRRHGLWRHPQHVWAKAWGNKSQRTL